MAYIIKNAKDEPILYDGVQVFMATLENVVKGVDLNKRQLSMTGSDETTDRDGDIVMVNGWELNNFLKNPVFLWSHQYSGPESVPLARAVKVMRKRSPARLDFVMQFPTEGINPFADMILQLYNEKIINASSVGFIPREWEPIDQKDDTADMIYMRGRKFTKQELLELSGCAVPCNPAALQNAVKGFMHPQTPKEKATLVVNWLMGKAMLDAKEIGVDEVELQGELQELKCEVEEEGPTMVQVPDQITVQPTEKDASQGVDNTDKKDYNIEQLEVEGEVEKVKTGQEAETKHVCGSRGLSLDTADSWDGAAARASLEAYAKKEDGSIDFGKYKKGFVFQDASADPNTKGAYKLPFAKASEGSLKAVWGGVKAAMGAVLGARGGAQLGDAKKACYNFLRSYYNAFDKPCPDFHSFDDGNEKYFKVTLVEDDENSVVNVEPVDLESLKGEFNVEGKLTLAFGQNITVVEPKEFIELLGIKFTDPVDDLPPSAPEAPTKGEEAPETPKEALDLTQIKESLKRLSALLPEVK